MQGAMSVADIKAVFNESAHMIGKRDCKVQPVSAVTGCVPAVMRTAGRVLLQFTFSFLAPMSPFYHLTAVEFACLATAAPTYPKAWTGCRPRCKTTLFALLVVLYDS